MDTFPPSPPPAPIFTLFPLLPTEIRLKIWTHASFEPRYLDLWATPQGTLFEDHQDTFTCHRLITLVSSPSILYTCSESREIGLQFYELAFGTSHVVKYGIEVRTPARIYVNWEVDVICPMAISGQKFPWDNGFPERENVRNLALNLREVIGEAGLSLETLLRGMPVENILLYYQRFPFKNYYLGSYRGNFKVGFVSFESVGNGREPAIVRDSRRSFETDYEEVMREEEEGWGYEEGGLERACIRLMRITVNGNDILAGENLPVEIAIR